MSSLVDSKQDGRDTLLPLYILVIEVSNTENCSELRRSTDPSGNAVQGPCARVMRKGFKGSGMGITSGPNGAVLVKALARGST